MAKRVFKYIKPHSRLKWIFKKWPECVRLFYRLGLSCVGCPMSNLENDVARQYHINLHDLISKLNNEIERGVRDK